MLEESGPLSGPRVPALIRGAGVSELSLHGVTRQTAPRMITKLTRRFAIA